MEWSNDSETSVRKIMLDMYDAAYMAGLEAGYKKAYEEFLPLLKSANEKLQTNGHSLLTLKEK